MITYNNEVKAIIEKNGGKVIYSSGNIIVATDISMQLARQLSLERELIETFTQLPLKPNMKNYTPTLLEDVDSAEIIIEGSGSVGSGG